MSFSGMKKKRTGNPCKKKMRSWLKMPTLRCLLLFHGLDPFIHRLAHLLHALLLRGHPDTRLPV